MVAKNAAEELVRHRLKRSSDHNARARALNALQDALDLPEAPLRIECYDMSHLQGTDYVGSMVVMEDGLPRPAEYRRFKVRNVPGNDDYAAMEEVLTRRLQAYLGEKELPVADRKRHFSYPPQLLLVDGGKGQLNVAVRVLEELGLEDEIPVAALAKQFEEVYLPGQADPVRVPRGSEALYLLQRVRDEAHRFAISYHRQLRGKRMTASVLDGVPGLGPARRKRLVAELGSIKAVRHASKESLEALPWLPKATAEALWEKIHGASTASPGREGQVLSGGSFEGPFQEGSFHEPGSPLPAEAEQLWEVNSAWWQECFTEGADPEYTEQIIPLLRELLEGAGPAGVLDIGCGEGQLSRVAASVPGVRRVVGIDPTRAQLEAALQRQPVGTSTQVQYSRRRCHRPSFPRRELRRGVRMLGLRAHRGDRRGAQRGRPSAQARRYVPIVLEPPAPPGAGQRLGGRPHTRGAVLAYWRLPPRAPRCRRSRQKRLDPLCPQTLIGVCERFGGGWALPDGNDRAGASRRFPGQGGRVPRGVCLPTPASPAGGETAPSLHRGTMM